MKEKLILKIVAAIAFASPALSTAAPFKLSSNTMDFYFTGGVSTMTGYRVEGNSFIYSLAYSVPPGDNGGSRVGGFGLMAVARDGKKLDSTVSMTYSGRYAFENAPWSPTLYLSQSHWVQGASADALDGLYPGQLTGTDGRGSYDLGITAHPQDVPMTGSFDEHTITSPRRYLTVDQQSEGDSTGYDVLNMHNQWTIGGYQVPVGGSGTLWVDRIVISFNTFDPVAEVPEPATVLLFGIGALALMRRRSKA